MHDVFVQKGDILQLELWQMMDERLRAGFSTRIYQDHHPFNLGLHVPFDQEQTVKNRQMIAEAVGLPLTKWVFAEQVHGTKIKIVDQSDAGKGAFNLDSALKGIDGLITKEKGIVCTAFFADCVPLYFYDPMTGYIGIAHAGWRGTVLGIAQKMVETFVSLDSQTHHILVVVGPCITQDKYEVDDRVISQIPDRYHQKVVISRGNGKYLLDLKQLNVEILLHSGIFRHNIDVTNFCTYSDEHLFFSHRREGAKAGRMLGYIGFI